MNQAHNPPVRGSEDIVDSQLVVIPNCEPLAQEPLNARSPVIRGLGPVTEVARIPNDLGVEIAKQARQVASKPCIPALAHDLHVLLRHRQPSIALAWVPKQRGLSDRARGVFAGPRRRARAYAPCVLGARGP